MQNWENLENGKRMMTNTIKKKKEKKIQTQIWNFGRDNKKLAMNRVMRCEE